MQTRRKLWFIPFALTLCLLYVPVLTSAASQSLPQAKSTPETSAVNSRPQSLQSSPLGGGVTIMVMGGGVAVAGAAVSVTVKGAVQTATTNASGKAAFTGLPAGSYTFTATKTGYNSTGSTTVALPVGAITTLTGRIDLGKADQSTETSSDNTNTYGSGMTTSGNPAGGNVLK